eukprot:918949-Karenia_brevis.AAC.1
MFDSDSDATAEHASPELFDAGCQTDSDQLECGQSCNQPQCGHLSEGWDSHASPELFDAGCQTEISIVKSWPNLFFA